MAKPAAQAPVSDRLRTRSTAPAAVWAPFGAGTMQVPVSALTASMTVGCRARSAMKLGDARSAAAMPALLRTRKGAASAGEGGVSSEAPDRLTVQAGGSTARCRAGSKGGAALADL